MLWNAYLQQRRNRRSISLCEFNFCRFGKLTTYSKQLSLGRNVDEGEETIPLFNTIQFYRVEVRLGEHDTGTELDCDPDLEQCSTAEDYRIKKLIPHEDYSSNTKQNDISLIFLDRDINFDTCL